MSSTTDWNRIKQAEDMLADARIKVDTDYALMAKYGEIHILCRDVFKDAIYRAFTYYGLAITSVHSVPSNGGPIVKS